MSTALGLLEVGIFSRTWRRLSLDEVLGFARP
jgi:hypothetical protein